ncbi:RluA family pseudouridine synthase [Bernardetia litoralis]|uniref:RluA family pseudouridine synthase n=1 Tax=Bernardetia litoralis TaxID=999 RepID=UPI0002DE4404|nr:RluA family pseudouridine synthase [Bernardetia litoralis]
MIPTKSALKKALKKNYITVNEKPATTATFINGGEIIILSIPKDENNNKPKREFIFPLKVLFEDEYLAIAHKPAGILVSGNAFKTVANALPQNLKPSNLEDVTIPQPVHRLDYGTTGALLVGKTASSIRALNKLFEDKEIDKTYYAVTIGKMKELEGIIKSEIDDKESQSNYKVIKSVISQRFEFLNLVKLYPKTGRRHQLRKHLASIGNPILGDKEYGIENLVLNGKGIYLHAYSLEFSHPFTKRNIFLEDELPQKFLKIFN